MKQDKLTQNPQNFGISEETRSKLTEWHYRDGIRAKDFRYRLKKNTCSPLEEEMLDFLLRHENQYHRTGILARDFFRQAESNPSGKRVIVEETGRKSIQNTISIIRKHLRNSEYEVRTIKLPGDRRTRAYGVFKKSRPDTSEAYINATNWDSIGFSYNP